jgi:ABC-type glycerol-3-phosphate transport system substrate-binding protein
VNDLAEKKVSRRKALKYGAGVVVAAAVAGTGYGLYEATKPTQPMNSTQPVTPPQQVTLWAIGESGPECLTFCDPKILAQFQSQTGIQVQTDLPPRESLREIGSRELVENTGRYDLIWDAGGELFFKGLQLGALYDVENLNAVDPDFLTQVGGRSNGLVQSKIDPATGKIGSWPISNGDGQMLFYRKDLFSDPSEMSAFKTKYGYDLAPPDTWAQMRDVAEFFTRPPNLYGYWTCGGVSWDITFGEFYTCLLSNGGEVMDNQGNVTINTPASAAAAWTGALNFQKEMSAFSPPGWQGLGKFDGLKLFEAGKIATHMQWRFCWPQFFNKDTVAPQVLNNVGLVAPPKAPTGIRKTGAGVMGWLIPKDAHHPNEAAQLIHWWQSFAIQKAMALTTNIFNPPRLDVMNDPDVDTLLHTKEFAAAPGLSELIVEQPGEIYTAKFDVSQPVLNEGYSKFMAGSMTVEDTLTWLQAQFEQIYAPSSSTTATTT